MTDEMTGVLFTWKIMSEETANRICDENEVKSLSSITKTRPEWQVTVHFYYPLDSSMFFIQPELFDSNPFFFADSERFNSSLSMRCSPYKRSKLILTTAANRGLILRYHPTTQLHWKKYPFQMRLWTLRTEMNHRQVLTIFKIPTLASKGSLTSMMPTSTITRAAIARVSAWTIRSLRKNLRKNSSMLRNKRLRVVWVGCEVAAEEAVPVPVTKHHFLKEVAENCNGQNIVVC